MKFDGYREVLFGYEWKAEELVINEKNASIVRWLYKMALEYMDNPPDFLIKEIMDNSEEKLSYDEAKERVTLTIVERYITAELNLRMEQYENNRQEDIQEFLRKPLDKELLTAVEGKYKSNSLVEYSVERISRYVEKVRTSSNQEEKPIITKEMYKRAVEKIEKCKE
ncbi:hypothetical protein [Clostridium sp. Marseille-QA1073]